MAAAWALGATAWPLPATQPSGFSAPVRTSLRFALAGMAGLACLSLTHWARGHYAAFGPTVQYALGILPNLAAAFAMPLILTSFLATDRTGAERAVSPRQFGFVAAFTCSGLVAWEFCQISRPPFRFDGDDIVATCVGTMLAALVFRRLRPS